MFVRSICEQERNYCEGMGSLRNMYQVDVVAAFDELDEEKGSDSVGFLAHREVVGRRHEGDLRIQVRTDYLFSRRTTSVLEKLTGWLPGNLVEE